MMPSYVNIGAYVDSGTMVDTWATVGSCAQIGKNVHLSGGVGIGGVLEPPQAVPVVVDDDCFIGSRCMIVDGARVRDGAKLGAGLVVTSTTHVIEAETGNELAARRHPRARGRDLGDAPEGVRRRHVRPSVRVRSCATRPRATAHDKLQLNAILREHGIVLLSADLLALTEELCAIPSVSGTERALADDVAGAACA